MTVQEWLKGLEGKVREAINQAPSQLAPRRVPVLAPVPVAPPRR